MELKKKGVKKISFFSRGKRGYIFTGVFNDKKVGIKVHNPHSEADSIHNEIFIMKKVNKFGVGPKFLFSLKNVVVYEFFEGEKVEDWTYSNAKEDITNMLVECLRQLRTLDINNIDKKEMSHPHKHVIV
ncbi:hypothetical protein BVX95_00970, partial [archaeon D22]